MGDVCITHLINYNGMDLISFKVPIIVSRYDVIEQLFKRPNRMGNRKPKLNNEFHLIKFEKPPLNSSCNIEKSLITQLETINLARPWLCEVTLYLFPPLDPTIPNNFFISQTSKLNIPIVYSKMWRIFKSEKYSVNETTEMYQETYSLYFVNTRNTYEVLITEYNEDQPVKIAEQLIKSKSPKVGYNQQLFSRRQWFLIQVGEVKNTGISEISNLFYICRFCSRCSEIKAIKLKNSEEIYSYENFIGVTYQNGAVLVAFDEGLNEANEEFYANLILKSMSNIRTFTTEVQQHIVYAILVQEILSNITILDGSNYRNRKRQRLPDGCSTELQAEFLPVLEISSSNLHKLLYGHYFGYSVNLKILGCGIESNLYFHVPKKLLSVFDKSTWTALMLSVSVLSLICWKFETTKEEKTSGGSLFILELFIWNMKVYIEQSPFPSRIFSAGVIRHKKIILGSSMLMGVVISNAFKSQNILKITAPLKRRELQTFKEMVDAKYEIFSRTRCFGINAGLVYEPLTLADPHTTKGVSPFCFSEIWSFIASKKPLTKWNSDIDKFIVENSKLHPKFWEMLESGKVLQNEGKVDPYFDLLKVCNKVAMILPEATLIMYKQSLSRLDLNVHTGSEVLSSKHFALRIMNWIHPNVLRRIAGLQSSGIIIWWNNLINNYFPIIKKHGIEHKKLGKKQDSLQVIFGIYVISVMSFGSLFFGSELIYWWGRLYKQNWLNNFLQK
ncbi:unnamed protein product [Orchesella dallaii]|uniref:Uncharacterized protein n=1 Tax=Orchesella dallaii TaxID=48710 RepID=A0ABP1RMM7_9HEXA